MRKIASLLGRHHERRLAKGISGVWIGSCFQNLKAVSKDIPAPVAMRRSSQDPLAME